MAISQEEIVSNAQTISKGLEALRQEHESMLGGMRQAREAQAAEVKVKEEEAGAKAAQEDSILSEKCALIEKSLSMIDLGLDEAYVMSALASHLQTVEAEKQKLRSQVKRLCQENAWLRDELATTQQKLQVNKEMLQYV